MDSILKKGVLLVSLTGIMTAFPMAVHAADIDDTQNIPAAGNTQILEDCYTSDKTIPVNDHLVPEQKGEYSDMAFANVQSFLYIRSEPTTDQEPDSDGCGKGRCALCASGGRGCGRMDEG